MKLTPPILKPTKEEKPKFISLEVSEKMKLISEEFKRVVHANFRKDYHL